MDIWFLDGFKRIIDMEEELKRCKGEPDIDTLKLAFIWVPRVRLAVVNLSKGRRGIFNTQ